MTADDQLGTWKLPATPSSVPKLRGDLIAAITDRGFDHLAVGLAATEAVSNVVLHAYPQTDGVITMTAQASPQELIVIVSDKGMGARSFQLSNAPETGMGLALIRELCSSVSIVPATDGTTITMRFAKNPD